jgi:hypothetical protein
LSPAGFEDELAANPDPLVRGNCCPHQANLEAGDFLEVFLDDFLSVSRESSVAVPEQARVALIADANPACACFRRIF